MAMATSLTYERSALTMIQPGPFNAEAPPGALTGAVTPTPLHYVRSNFLLPAHDGTLTIGGAVGNAMTLTLDDLRAMPAIDQAVTLECAGNGRLGQTPLPVGEPWGRYAVSTARWRGVPLHQVLRQAAPAPNGVDVTFEGADHGHYDQYADIAFVRSLALGHATDPAAEILIAYEMNGEPLSPDHGAPFRLVVPGWYGMASVKWLARLRLLERKFEGFFQVNRYVIGDRPLREIAARALITWPHDGERLAARPFVARGYAWSGGGDLARVEISADGGKSWRDAALGGALTRYAWRQWDASVAPRAGRPLVLLARAVTTDGATQPLNEVRNALGYANNAARPLRIEID
jgi:DMSO/TMAO reductase YedYZ molybdopterin-dependent catalytic subunit